MATQTPAPWSIPYPIGTDRVMDGDNAMQAIAERVTALLDNPPRPAYVTNLPMLNGWAGNILYVRMSGWMHVVISGTKATWNSGEVIAQMPAGLRPNYAVTFAGFGANSGRVVPITLAFSGQITVILSSAVVADSGGVSAHTAYPAYL